MQVRRQAGVLLVSRSLGSVKIRIKMQKARIDKQIGQSAREAQLEREVGGIIPSFDNKILVSIKFSRPSASAPSSEGSFSILLTNSSHLFTRYVA